MRKLLVLALVGLASQLVDGALGMGYGVTSLFLSGRHSAVYPLQQLGQQAT